MKHTTLFLSVFVFGTLSLQAADTLSVQQVRDLALQRSPLQQQKALAETAAALHLHNIKSNNLPRIQFGAQATYQSDVFGFPVDNPALPIPEVPKDQYKVSVDIAERLWDGNSDQYLRRQRNLVRDLTAAQTDVDVFQLREAVTDLYFKILLLQESEAILEAAADNLRARLKQAEAAVENGVALRTSADQVRINLLQTEQQIAAIRADRQTLKTVLAVWLDRQDTDFLLQAGTPVNTGAIAPQALAGQRPEYRLFALRQDQTILQQDMLRLKAQPRVELFAQGGFGRPNPFNFFETGFEPFGIVGLRAVWTPIDWGNRSREREALTLQSHMVDAQRQAFEQRLEASTTRDQADIAKARALLQQDDAIIALQEDIVRRAEAQVQNGVMTTTDYLSQVNLLTQARLTRKTHEIQALQAQELLQAKLGDN
ncbi:MAG: TolC family protein [Bacteroidetes bacterium]|nr:MAG: TolC family protein [Bacteroidota bacterium]